MAQIIIDGRIFHTVTCPSCGTFYAISEVIYKAANERFEKMSIFCPNGHTWHFVKGESDLDKMRRDRDRLAQRVAERDDEVRHQRELREHAERSASAYKGKVTRLKNRAAAGLCPCCNRTFQNLAKHMVGQHPTFKHEEAAE